MLLLIALGALATADNSAHVWGRVTAPLTEFDTVVRRHHRGYKAAPETLADQEGSTKQIFRTQDEWICEVSTALRCVNEHEGKKFVAVNWRGGRERLRVHLGGGDYTDLFSACDFFGYPRPTPADFSLEP